jgi:hypothetical protein
MSTAKLTRVESRFMCVNSESVRMWKEIVVACFKTLSQSLSGETAGN